MIKCHFFTEPIPGFTSLSYFNPLKTSFKKARAALGAGECVLSTGPIPDFAGLGILAKTK